MENENENKNESHIREELIGERELTMKSLSVMAVIIVTLLGAIASGFAFIDNKYVSQEIYDAHIEENTRNIQRLDDKTAQALEALEYQNAQEFNRVYKAIKDGTAMPLIVRRDILLSRGDDLSPEERAELSILNAKLNELNVD